MAKCFFQYFFLNVGSGIYKHLQLGRIGYLFHMLLVIITPLDSYGCRVSRTDKIKVRILGRWFRKCRGYHNKDIDSNLVVFERVYHAFRIIGAAAFMDLVKIQVNALVFKAGF